MVEHEEMDRHLQDLARRQGRPGLSVETAIHYAQRVGRQHPEDLAAAIEVWAGRTRFPSPAQLWETCLEAKGARLEQEARERRNMAPARQPASPEFVRARLADLRRQLADTPGPPSFYAEPEPVLAGE